MSNQGQGSLSDARPEEGVSVPYTVTRGKPPREHQFKPGTSGNPRGRPPGSKDFRTLIQRELDRSISATVGGRPTKVSKREAIAMRLVEKALKGDHKSIEACLKLSGEVDASGPSLPPMDTDPSRDAELLAAYLARQRDGAGHG